jgi:hypothetical protein
MTSLAHPAAAGSRPPASKEQAMAVLSQSARARRRERREYRILCFVAFAFFLAVAALERLLPRRWRSLPRGGKRGSIIADARAATYSTVPFVFMC